MFLSKFLSRARVVVRSRIFSQTSISSVPRFAFESNFYSDPSDESNLIEKSFRNGCRTLLTQSGPSLMSNLELIQDLQISEDISIQNCEFGHRLTCSVNQMEDLNKNSEVFREWTNELKLISQYYPLSFVTLPNVVSPMKNGLVNTSTELVCQFVSEIVSIFGNKIKIGLDFPTSILSRGDEEISNLLIKKVYELNRLSKTDDKYFPLSALTIATNSFTFQNASKIISFAKSLGIYVIATDVLRVHSFRPGQISFPAQILNGRKDNHPEVLQKALNSCFQMETKYLQFQNPPVSPQNICWGHNIANLMNTTENVKNNNIILFQEEWNYLFRTQVKPCLDESMDSLSRNSKEYKNWLEVYKPLVNVLLRSYMDELIERKVLMCKEISNDLQKNNFNIKSEDSSLFIGELAKSLSPDVICLSDVTVNSNYYKNNDHDIDLILALELWQKIKNIVDTFDN